MDAQIEPIDATTRKITLTIASDRIDARLDSALDRLRKEVKLPGFRRGHVPRKVIEQQLGREVRTQLAKDMAREAVGEVVRSHGIRQAAEPTIETGKLVRGKPLSVTARVVLRPEIEVTDYGPPASGSGAVEVDDAEIDEHIESMRQQARRLLPVEEARPMTADDLAEVTVTLRSEGYPDYTLPGALVGPGVEDTAAFVRDIAVGLAPGESRTGIVQVPDDFGDATWAGARCEATVDIVKLLRPEAPPLDDEFAKLMGSDSLADLRSTLRDSILRARLERVEGRRQRRVVEQLIERNPFEVPSVMIRDRAADIVKALGVELAGSGLGSQAPGLDDLEDDKRQDVLAEAEFSVRRQLLLEAVARREKIEVDESDRLARYGVIAERTGQSIDTVRSVIEAGDARPLDAAIIEEKAMAWLLERAGAHD